MHHYPRHIGDYQKDTADLSLAEHGAYSLLLDHYYAHEQPLPTERDRLYRICKASTKSEKAAVDAVVGRYFVATDGGSTNKRCDSVIAEYKAKADLARENGRRGGRPPKPPEQKTDEEPTRKPDGFSVGSKNTGFENRRGKLTNNHKPITSNQENTNPPIGPPGGDPAGDADPHEPTASKPSLRTALFERWYAVYPKRVGPEHAAKAFRDAMKRIAPRHPDREAALEWLMLVTADFALSPKGQGKFCWNPATFLNQGHYDDDQSQWQRDDGEHHAGRRGAAVSAGAGQVHPDDDKGF